MFVSIMVVSTLWIGGCNRIPANAERSPMTPLSQRLAPLFTHTKIVCFSQFLVEVPVTATVVYGPTTVEWPIQHYPHESERVDQRVAAILVGAEKNRRFLATRHLAELHRFGTVIDGAVPGQKLIFGSNDEISYTIDSVIPIGDDLFIQHAESVPSNKDSEQIALLNAVAKKLRLRDGNEIPLETGACIEGGFIGRHAEFESLALGIRLKEFPDVHFSIETLKRHNLVDSDALEPRLKQAEQDAHNEGKGHVFSRIKTLRRGSREFNNWKGFEILTRKPAHDDDTEAHEFLFVSSAVPNDPLRPMIELQLNTGVANNAKASVKPSITDEEAIALWEKLTGSIRVRPIGGIKNNAEMPLKTPLGAFIDSGEKCPHTGLWQCSDDGEIAGGRRRHFTAGERMAEALLLGKPSFLQKLMRTRPTREISTTWELVSYQQVAASAPPATSAWPPQQDSSADNSLSDSRNV
ncbi:MAG: T6SS immunity protein Tli4 family protein [Pseudomonadota bacterium]